MIAINETVDQACRRLLVSFFMKFSNPRLQVETDRVLKFLLARKIPMPGKPGGWAGEIIYAPANLVQRPCGIPGLLNKECEEFFNASMGAIYRQAAKKRVLLLL